MFAAIRKAGFVRVRVDGEVLDVDQVPELAPRKNHTIEAVVDRIVVREGIEARLAEIDATGPRARRGRVLVDLPQPGENGETADPRDKNCLARQAVQHALRLPELQISFEELEPRTFSFNSPYGACPACEGLGCRVQFDPELVVADGSLSLADGAVAPWKGGTPAETRKRRRRRSARS